MSSAVRKQAPRPAKPVGRYWQGKAPKGTLEAESESDAEEEDNQQLEDGDVPIGGDQDIAGDDEEEEEEEMQLKKAARPQKIMNVALKDVSISNEGKVIVAGREESGRTQLEGESIIHLVRRLFEAMNEISRGGRIRGGGQTGRK